jgi:biotin carboxyl carrier protein
LLLEFRYADETKTVEVTHQKDVWRLVIEGREVPVEAFKDQAGSWCLDTPQGRRRLWVAAKGDQRLIWCDGKVHVLDLPDPDLDAAEDLAAAGPGLFAAMPGKVVKVLVEAGEVVEGGQAVLILESMKMETELTAAVGGTVAVIHVRDGQLVGQGDALVDITPTPEGDSA